MRKVLIGSLMMSWVLMACGEEEPAIQGQIVDPTIGFDERAVTAYCANPYWYCSASVAEGGAGGYAAIPSNSSGFVGPWAQDTCTGYNLTEDQESVRCNTTRQWLMTSSYTPVAAGWTYPCTRTGAAPSWTLTIPDGSPVCAVSFTRYGSFYDGWDCTYPSGATFSNHFVNAPGYCDMGFVECAMTQGTWTQPPSYKAVGGPCLGTCTNINSVCQGTWSSTATCQAHYGWCGCKTGYQQCGTTCIPNRQCCGGCPTGASCVFNPETGYGQCEYI